MPIRSQFDTEAEWLEHLRSYFAGQALAGMCSHTPHDYSQGTHNVALATRAYDIADSMIAERDK